MKTNNLQSMPAQPTLLDFFSLRFHEQAQHVFQSAARAMRSSSGRGNCTPTLYVDGRRDMSGEFDIYRADELGGIEVYSRQTMVPAEFMEMGGCGVIAVWTRQRPPRVKKD